MELIQEIVGEVPPDGVHQQECLDAMKTLWKTKLEDRVDDRERQRRALMRRHTRRRSTIWSAGTSSQPVWAILDHESLPPRLVALVVRLREHTTYLEEQIKQVERN